MPLHPCVYKRRWRRQALRSVLQGNGPEEVHFGNEWHKSRGDNRHFPILVVGRVWFPVTRARDEEIKSGVAGPLEAGAIIWEPPAGSNYFDFVKQYDLHEIEPHESLRNGADYAPTATQPKAAADPPPPPTAEAAAAATPPQPPRPPPPQQPPPSAVDKSSGIDAAGPSEAGRSSIAEPSL